MSGAACLNSAPSLVHEASCELLQQFIKNVKKPPDLFDPAVLNIHFSCSL
jgi:hypothetical protein